jgi:hypothetical protein
MKNFCNIPININFNGGAFVEIQDSSSEKYLIEFYENTGYGWSLVSNEITYQYSWFKYVAKQFRVNWKIKVYAWYENNVVQVCEHTYNEMDENILLKLKTDSYEECLEWFNLSLQHKKNTGCNLHIYSKFNNRLKLINKSSEIIFEDKDEVVNNTNTKFYASYSIDRHHFAHLSYGEWGTGWSLYQNHTEPNVSYHHRNDWLKMNSKQLFNDIMNL